MNFEIKKYPKRSLKSEMCELKKYDLIMSFSICLKMMKSDFFNKK
jgi:hypothetical protein